MIPSDHNHPIHDGLSSRGRRRSLFFLGGIVLSVRFTAAVAWGSLALFAVRFRAQGCVCHGGRRCRVHGRFLGVRGVNISVPPGELLRVQCPRLRRWGGAALYGTNPWHWYATAGLPAVLGVWVVPCIVALINCAGASEKYRRSTSVLVIIVVITRGGPLRLAPQGVSVSSACAAALPRARGGGSGRRVRRRG